MHLRRFIGIACVVASLGGGAGQAHDGPELQAAMRDYILANPHVLIEALNAYAEAQAREAMRAVVAPVLADLAADDTAISYGASDPARVLYEFFDYRCQVCRANEPVLDALLQDDPDLALIKVHLPILSPGSERAVRYVLSAQALRGPASARALHERLYARLGTYSEAELRRAAVAVGLDHDQIWAGMDTPEIDARIRANRDMALALDIRGTPTFVTAAGMLTGGIERTDLLGLLTE